jgi:salicylate hydroxylase
MLVQLLLAQPNPEGYSAWEHKTTSTYAHECMCIIGDAAHAMTPWQGAGGGQAIEDAMIMGALFSKVSSVQDIKAVFQAFDAVRRPRCQRIIDSSRETGQIMCGQIPEVGLDAGNIRQALRNRWKVIHDLDLSSHSEQAVKEIRKLQARARDP